MSTPITEQEFERLADAELKAIDAGAPEVDGLEVSLQMGILTYEFADGTKYVVNSHRAARQIWMAAELRAWHFDYDASTRDWRATKTGDELRQAISGAVSRKLGRPFDLAVVGKR